MENVRKLPEVKYQELELFIDNLEAPKESLIQVLHKAQSIFGYLPSEVQLFIARKLDIPASEVFGVVSFYSYFSTEPKGEHTISVCMGTACYVKGSEKLMNRLESELNIKSGETTKDNKFTLKGVRCIGACGLAPVITVNEKVYGKVKEDDIKNILNEYI
ncbi:NADH-quinone oxidoreductase subunit NuoE [Senegalia massiliensis]|uniref:NADH-quinone oxidoreductase subunit NuoE n=1 Tax=Senegalia massiliensis TaxID=1720316 RepID=A0A845QZ07_9CLOT|nr:NADH-quinone oxidoreductase subunit NuoE [Senegalia massiliensis]